MKHILFMLAIAATINADSQELYSATEPASNMAAKSAGIRFDNSMMDDRDRSKINYHLIPEIMIGVTKKLMLHSNVFFSNRKKRFSWEGGSIYAKYRFLSIDALQKHFRMAAYARMSYNNSDIHQEEVNINGHNTGMETGIIATQLLKKVALSSMMSYIKVTDNGDGNKYVYGSGNSEALNFSLSIGKLMLPREYRNYRQTNLNLMAEFLSQVNTGSGKYYVDLASSVQFIINSQSRIDLGYRYELSSDMTRTAPNGFFIRLEHNLFNAF